MLKIISRYYLESYLDYLRYLDIYNHINCLTFKCNMNTIREVYWKSSVKSTSIEMCNNHEYSIMQIFWVSIIPKLLTQLFTAIHVYTYIVYGIVSKIYDYLDNENLFILINISR